MVSVVVVGCEGLRIVYMCADVLYFVCLSMSESCVKVSRDGEKGGGGERFCKLAKVVPYSRSDIIMLRTWVRNLRCF